MKKNTKNFISSASTLSRPASSIIPLRNRRAAKEFSIVCSLYNKDSVKTSQRERFRFGNAPAGLFYFVYFRSTPDRNGGYLHGTVERRCCTADCSCLDMLFSPFSRYCFDTEIPSSAHSFCDSLHSTQHSFSCMESWKSTPFNSNKNNRPVRSNSCKDAPQTKRLRLLMDFS